MKARAIVAVVLLAVALFGVPNVSGLFTPPRVEVKEPSDQMKDTIKPLVRIVAKMSPIDRVWLNTIYANAARVVEADGIVEPQTISTTESLQAVHVAILKYIWIGMAQNKPGEYEGLSEAVEAAITEVIGDTSKPMTPELRRKAAEVFEAIAWAGLGRG